MMRWLLSLTLLVGLAQAQGLRPFGVKPAVAGSFALVTSASGQSGRALSLTCVTTVCTLTVPSTGAGHGLVLGVMASNGSGITISSVSGGCSGSWVVDASSHQSSASVVDINTAYCLSSSGSATSVAATMSSAPGTAVAIYYEFSWSGTSISKDVSGSGSNSSSTTPAGQALTLTGSGNQAIFQFLGTAAGFGSAVTSPYDTNLINHDSFPTNYSFTSGSFALTSSGTAPTWTLSGSAALTLVSGIAFKGN